MYRDLSIEGAETAPVAALERAARAAPRRIEIALTDWMARQSIRCLRVSLGIVFVWFGALKFFPGMSPAEDLAERTIGVLTFGSMAPSTSILVLATWECLIGAGLILGVCLRATLCLLFLQMLGTVTPFLFFPHELFTRPWYAPTLEGQYIIKNLVLISAGAVIGATVRGGGVVSDPEVMRRSGAAEAAHRAGDR